MSPVLADVSYPNEGDEVTVQADNTHDAVDDDFFHSTVVNAPIPVDINSGDEDDRENDSPPQPNDVGDIHQQHRRPRCLVHRVTVDTSREIASRDMIVNNSIRQSNLCLSWKYVVLAAVVALSLGIPAIFLYLSSHDNRQDTSSINGQSPTKDSPAYTEEGNTYLRELRTQILGIDTFRLEPDSAEIVATDWMAYADSPRVSLNDTVRLEQRYGLLVLYFEMGGIDWHFIGWADNPGIHECDWERVVCNDRGRVQELHLGDDVYLAGSLSEEIRFLSSLRSLALSRNRIEGTIPKGLYSLTNLVSLDLSGNEFAGILDSDIGKLTNLEELYLEGNFLSGTFPDGLKSLSKLKTFSIYVNLFDGDPWSLISSWPDVEHFKVGVNALRGTIPTEIGQLSRLVTIDCSETSISGTIPTEIGLLGRLKSFRADVAPLEGPIPTEIGNLGLALTNLQLQGCDMKDTSIPSELGRCTSLVTLHLSLSGLIGTLPSELGMLIALTTFDASDNFFTGSIPEEFVNLVALYKFTFFGDANLSGSLPSGMCDLDIAGGIYVSPQVQCDCCNYYAL